MIYLYDQHYNIYSKATVKTKSITISRRKTKTNNIVNFDRFITDLTDKRVSKNKRIRFTSALSSAKRCIKLSAPSFMPRIGVAGIDPETGTGLIRLDIDVPFKIANQSVLAAFVGMSVMSDNIVIASGEPDGQMSFSFMFNNMLSDAPNLKIVNEITSDDPKVIDRKQKLTTQEQRLLQSANLLAKSSYPMCRGVVSRSAEDQAVQIQLILPALLLTAELKEAFATVLATSRLVCASLSLLPNDDEAINLQFFPALDSKRE